MEDEEEELDEIETQTTPAFNSGGDVISRINWTQWQINEALRLKDHHMVFVLLKTLYAEVCSELDDETHNTNMLKIDQLDTDYKEWNEYHINYSQNCKSIPYNPKDNIKNFPYELEKLNMTLKRLIKKCGLGMPNKDKFSGVGFI